MILVTWETGPNLCSHAPLDEEQKEDSGSRFKNTVYFFRSGSGSLVTVTDQRVDSRKRQRQPYASTRTAISYLSRLRSAFLSTAFSYSIFILAQLDLTAPSALAGGALFRCLTAATFCCFRAGTNCRLLHTARYINKVERFWNLPTSRGSNLPRGLAKTDANRQKYQNRLTLKTHTKVKRHQNLSNKR